MNNSDLNGGFESFAPQPDPQPQENPVNQDPFSHTQPNFGVPSTPANKKKKGMEVAALICGIGAVFFSCICCCFYILTPVLSILGILFAILSKKQNEGKMSGMALAGLILAIVGLMFFACIVAIDIYIGTHMEEIEAFLEESTGMNLDEFFADIEGSMAYPRK